MPQADGQVQNASFPAVRTDITDNLQALFSQSSGPSAPAVTVAFQPWIDTSTDPATWRIRNAANSGWITLGTVDSTGFAVGGITPIANGGTGATTAATALAALLPNQTGQTGKALTTDGTVAGWGAITTGVSVQVFTASGTYTPTPGKVTFLVLATGGGGSGYFISPSSNFSGGGGGTSVRVYNTTEIGASAAVTVGAGGAGGGGGGNTTFDPGGSGLTITGYGGTASGGSTLNSIIALSGRNGASNNTTVPTHLGGSSFWGCAFGIGGSVSANGSAGVVVVLEW